MTPIESIFEIKSAVLDHRQYLQSKDKVVCFSAQIKYEEWIDRFIREKINLLKPEKRRSLRILYLQGFDYFIKLLESTVEHYGFELEK
jgi:hypothetical protein